MLLCIIPLAVLTLTLAGVIWRQMSSQSRQYTYHSTAYLSPGWPTSRDSSFPCSRSTRMPMVYLTSPGGAACIIILASSARPFGIRWHSQCTLPLFSKHTILFRVCCQYSNNILPSLKWCFYTDNILRCDVSTLTTYWNVMSVHWQHTRMWCHYTENIQKCYVSTLVNNMLLV